jgi:imidazolonepropionase-like amidohydrolase
VSAPRRRRRTALVAGLIALALFAGIGWLLGPPVLPVAEQLPALVGVTVINPGRDRRPNQTVILRGGIIESIEDLAPEAWRLPRLARAYRNHYVVPGLIDMDIRQVPSVGHLQRMFGAQLLAAGVTTVRVAGRLPDEIRTLQDRIARGVLAWPRLIACGPVLVGERATCGGGRVVRTAADAAAAVAELAAQGANCVAVERSLDGGVLAAVRAAAADRRLPVVGDVPAGMALRDAPLADVWLASAVVPAPPARQDADWLRSWQTLDVAGMEALVHSAAEHGTAVTSGMLRWVLLTTPPDAVDTVPFAPLMPRFYRETTWPAQVANIVGHDERGASRARLTPAELSAAAAAMQHTIRRLRDAGVPIHIGSGAPLPYLAPGGSMWLELRVLVNLGIPLEDAWQAATSGAGAALGIPKLGMLEPGAPADLLVFATDPTQDPDAFSKLKAVVSQGRLYPELTLARHSMEYAAYVRHPLYDAVSRQLVRLATWWNGVHADCAPL